MASANPAAAQTAATGQAASASELQEVVVTARRREERLQDVPVAVTAVTPEALRTAQVTTVRQLTALVPSMNVNTGNQRDFQRITLRGQGATLGAGDGVSVYFADAPMPLSVSGGPGRYYDLDNVQVLNGPQGTLFGRNTTGGAVLFTPKRPQFQNGGYLQLGYGNYSNKEADGAVNYVAIPDQLAFRLAGEFRQRDGFTRNVHDGSRLDDINYGALRAGVLWTPTKAFEDYLVVDYVRSSTNGTGFILSAVNPAGIAAAAFPGVVGALTAAQQRGIRETDSDSQNWFYTKNIMAVNTATLHISDDLSIKSITSFTRTQSSGGYDFDGSPFPIVGWIRDSDSMNPSFVGQSKNDFFTQELQVGGKALDKKLDWILGGFYQRYYPFGSQNQQVVQFGSLTQQDAAQDGSNKAIFGQASLDLGIFSPALDRLKLTAGYRYTWDKERFFTSQFLPNSGNKCVGLPGVFPACGLNFSGTWSAPTWMVGLDYKVTDRTLVYFDYRTGYKSGGFNTSTSPNSTLATFGPENVTDYEVGLKSDFHLAEVPVRTNLALFKDDYSHIQRNQSFLVPGNPPQLVNAVGNSGIATIKGFEAQITAKLLERLDLDLNYSYLDTRYENSIPSAFIFEGEPLPFAPKNKIGGSVTYHLPVDPSLGDMALNLTASYQSTYRTTDQVSVGTTLGDYTLVNITGDWRNVMGKSVDIQAFITNLANVKAAAGNQPYYTQLGTVSLSYIEPRMFGVRVRYAFGAN